MKVWEQFSLFFFAITQKQNHLKSFIWCTPCSVDNFSWHMTVGISPLNMKLILWTIFLCGRVYNYELHSNTIHDWNKGKYL